MGKGLYEKVQGEGGDVVLLHGLFGQGGNLQSIAKALEGRFRVHSLDLLDHGRSPWSAEPSITGYAEAVNAWMTVQGIEDAFFLGHSLGGKVAMALALKRPERVKRLVVADIAPVSYEPSHEAVFQGLEAVAVAGCQTRKAAGVVLENFIEELGVRQFLLMSLVKDEGSGAFDWRLNHRALAKAYPSLLRGVSSESPFDEPALFIRGEKSAYVGDDHLPVIRRLFPFFRLTTLAGAGHWLHAEAPKLFNEQVLTFFSGSADP